MGLLNLPAEIIDVILDLSLPSGIEGLSLVCKAIYGRAKSQIERHNALKRRWKRANNRTAGRLDDTLGILDAIARNPLVAEYIETLDLWDLRHISHEDDELLDCRGDKEAMERVKRMVTSLSFLKDANVDTEAWWNTMMKEEESRTSDVGLKGECTTVTLLGLLTNLKTLRLDTSWHIFDPERPENELPQSGLQSIINKATQSSGSRPQALSHMQTILPFLGSGYQEWAPLQRIQPLLTLGSVSEVYLSSVLAVDNGYTDHPFHWRTPTLAAQLTRIELAYSAIEADGISELLRHTPNLTVLKYSHETKWLHCGYDWNAGAFVEAIARYCGNTITELAITIDDLSGEIINGVSSLHSFQRLEYLEVDVHVFRGPPIESGQQLGYGSTLPEGVTPWNEHDIPCIGSMLPESIKEVQINTDFPTPDERALESLLKNLRAQRLERLHQMERCIVRQYTAESARVYAERAGATLETFDLGIQQPRRRSMMPAWKRAFHERLDRLETGE